MTNDGSLEADTSPAVSMHCIHALALTRFSSVMCSSVHLKISSTAFALAVDTPPVAFSSRTLVPEEYK